MRRGSRGFPRRSPSGIFPLILFTELKGLHASIRKRQRGGPRENYGCFDLERTRNDPPRCILVNSIDEAAKAIVIAIRTDLTAMLCP